MSKFLETLKSRFAEAQVRHRDASTKFQTLQAEFNDTHKRFQAANTEFQAASQEMAGWAKAVEAETKREGLDVPVATGTLQKTIPASTAALPIIEAGGDNTGQVNNDTSGHRSSFFRAS